MFELRKELVHVFTPGKLVEMLGNEWEDRLGYFALLHMVRSLRDLGMLDYQIAEWFARPHPGLPHCASPGAWISRDHVAVWHIIPPPPRRSRA